MAQRLAVGDAGLAARLVVQAGIELRSAGQLTLASDWNLARLAQVGNSVVQQAGTPIALTLRAASHLNLQASLSDGFANVGNTVAAASAVLPGAFVLAGESARLRLVGGADLASADVMATVREGSGDVRIGSLSTASTPPAVLVRSSTGAIDIAAAQDIVLQNRQAVVYTTGTPQSTSGLAGYVRPPAALLINTATGRQGTLLSGGGAISLSAGRDLVGGSNGASQLGTDWWWRSSGGNVSTGNISWWSRYDLFTQGFATFGGGALRASAGRDALGLGLSAADSGVVLPAGADGTRPWVQAGGGTVSLQAGRDVVDSFILAGGRSAEVDAGRALVASTDGRGLQLMHRDTAITLQARNDLAIGQVVSAGLAAPLSQQGNLATNGLLLGGLSSQASLEVRSGAGKVLFTGQAPAALAGNYAQASAAQNVIPSAASITAPLGDIQVVGDLRQAPAAGADLQMLAGGQLQLSGLSATGSLPAMGSPFATGASAISELLEPFPKGQGTLEVGSRTPVRLVAGQGDLRFDSVQLVSSARLIAGQDLRGRSLSLMHQTADALSLVQAGRDVTLDASVSDASFSLKVQGPGNLVVVAGRDVVLGSSGGIGSVGNLENALLPSGGADVVVLAGVTLGAQGDLAQAHARYAHVLGGAGLASWGADLLVQLEALAGNANTNTNANTATLGSAANQQAADAFSALGWTARRDRVQALLGSTALGQAAQGFIAERDLTAGTVASSATATPAQALQAMETLTPVLRDSFLNAALAQAWLGRVPAAQQAAQVAALAAARQAAPSDATQAAAADPRTRYPAELIAFVAQRSGQPVAGLAQALQGFSQLAPEVQLLFTQGVLFDELRVAGRAAAAAADEAQRSLAYERGFNALSALFPGTRPSGNLRMTATQIKSQQGGTLRLLAPGGGINAGETFTGSVTKAAGAIGIVTVAGGAVEAAVRDSLVVNQSRVFTVGQGDVLVWASRGDIDAGRGAKTVTGAPPPLYKIDSNGNVVVDASGSFSGSGIAVLDAGSTLDLFAPAGAINAGDAGIQSRGNANLAAQRFAGTDALQVGGSQTGGAAAAPVNAAAAAPPVTSAAATASASSTSSPEDDERKKRRRRNLFLDFLGFSQGD